MESLGFGGITTVDMATILLLCILNFMGVSQPKPMHRFS